MGSQSSEPALTNNCDAKQGARSGLGQRRFVVVAIDRDNAPGKERVKGFAARSANSRNLSSSIIGRLNEKVPRMSRQFARAGLIHLDGGRFLIGHRWGRAHLDRAAGAFLAPPLPRRHRIRIGPEFASVLLQRARSRWAMRSNSAMPSSVVSASRWGDLQLISSEPRSSQVPIDRPDLSLKDC